MSRYTLTTVAAHATDNLLHNAMVQLSDGTLAYLAWDNASGHVCLFHSPDHATSSLVLDLGATISNALSTINYGTVIAICRDDVDNLYVAYGGTANNFGNLRRLNKGAGYTWTLHATTKTLGWPTAQYADFAITWVSQANSGITGGRLHIFGKTNALSQTQVANVSVADYLNNTFTNSSSSTGSSTADTTFGIQVVNDGFGATDGWLLLPRGGASFDLLRWTAPVGGNGGLSDANIVSNQAIFNGGNAHLIRAGSNLAAVVAVNAAGTQYVAGRYSKTAVLTALAAFTTPTNLPVPASVAAQKLMTAFADPQVANRLWIMAQTGTTAAGTLWRASLDVGSAVTPAAAAVSEGVVASTATGTDGVVGLRTVKHPSAPTRVDYQLTDTTPTPDVLYGDRVAFNTAPNAPTLTAPANASYSDLAAAGATFAGTFSDPDPGDAMTAYAMRRKVSGAGAYEYWNASTNAWQSTIVWNTLAGALSVTFGAGKWTNGNIYNWSFATADASSMQGPFAADFTVTASNPPAATVTAPTGTITTTATPTITWTDTLDAGITQTNYRVIVESGGYGTVPGSGVTVWDSGSVASAATSVAVPVANRLTNGLSFRFFVRITATGAQQSAWSYTTATLALTPPNQPSLVATEENNLARVRLDVTAGAGGPGGTYYLIERSEDGGASWVYVRGAAPTDPLAYGAAATTYDYEATPSTALLYRVTTVLSSSGNLVYSAASATDAALLAPDSAWLKDPLDPDRNIALSCLDGITPTRARDVAVLQPLGAVYPVVQVGVRHAKALTVAVTPGTQEEADALDELLSDEARVLLLQRPAATTGWRGVSLYVIVSGDDSAAPLGDVPLDTATVSFPVTEVPAPELV